MKIELKMTKPEPIEYIVLGVILGFLFCLCVSCDTTAPSLRSTSVQPSGLKTPLSPDTDSPEIPPVESPVYQQTNAVLSTSKVGSANVAPDPAPPQTTVILMRQDLPAPEVQPMSAFVPGQTNPPKSNDTRRLIKPRGMNRQQRESVP